MQFNKTFGLALVAAAALALSAGLASALTVTFSNGGGNGVGVDLGTGASNIAVLMTSNNNGKKNKASTWSFVSDVAAVVTVDPWSYSTQDKRNSTFDPLGYFIGSDYFALSTPKKPHAVEGGTYSFSVAANEVFGWILKSTDGKKGRSTATIYADLAPAAVPLPAGGLMLLGAVGGLAALRRRKGAAAV